jgi:type IV pilus assembly protein PilE
MNIKKTGFTLIELVVAVCIVGILSAIAIPSYKQHTNKSRRAEAQGALVTFANAMEQWRLQCGNYCNADTGDCSEDPTNLCSYGPPAPAIFPAVVPISGGTATYDLTISAVTETTYTLTATPLTTSSQKADGALSISNNGSKTCEKPASCLNGNGSSW